MDDICRTYGLRPIKLVDKPLFDAAFASLVQPVSEYTFANTFIWRTGEKLYWAPIEGHLCVFADGNEDLTMLYPPVGDGDLALCLKRCFEIMDDYNARRGGRQRSRIEYASEEMLVRTGGLGLTVAPMGGDYVYDMARLIDLAGSDLKSKRHARNRFLRDNDVWTEPLRPEHVAECRTLLRSWRNDMPDAVPGGTLEPTDVADAALIRHRRRLETLATEQALQHFHALDLTGMVVRAGQRLVGFTFGQPLTSRQASIVIEKADRRFVGAAQFIFSEFCSRYWREYPECNAGDDWDIPGLAWTKASYRPITRLRKWTLRNDNVPVVVGFRSRASTPGDAPITIRPAAVADGSAIVSLEQGVFPAADAFTAKQVRYLLRSPHALSVVACTDDFARSSANASPDCVVGWAVTLLKRHNDGTSARLYSLAVDPGCRGRRIGETLVQHVLDQLERRHIGRCFLEVREENMAARRLYERFGFRYVKHLPNYYGDGAHGWSMLRVHEGTPASEATTPELQPITAVGGVGVSLIW